MLSRSQTSRRILESRVPGGVDMWVFVLGDLIIFSVYFIVFMVYRAGEPGLFAESQRHLWLSVGAINTLVLLTSSRFAASAVQAARAGGHRRAQRSICYAGCCGLLFALIKSTEWLISIRHGFTLPHDDFFMFYYTLTGVHLLHVLIGLIILAVVLVELRDPRLRRASVIEAGAVYWHMVDLLWIVIFALIYVMR